MLGICEAFWVATPNVRGFCSRGSLATWSYDRIAVDWLPRSGEIWARY